MSAPIAATDVWQAVMERAGYRCQCTSCPRHPRAESGRCETEANATTHLMAGPVDPGTDPMRTLQAADPAALIAWCAHCYDRAVASARKRARHLARVASPAETLF